MAGIPVTSNDLSYGVGQTVVDLRNTFDRIVRLKAWLDGKTDQDLVDLGIDVGDVATIKSAYADLANLVATARGQRAQPEASDFFFWANRLTGIN